MNLDTVFKVSAGKPGCAKEEYMYRKRYTSSGVATAAGKGRGMRRTFLPASIVQGMSLGAPSDLKDNLLAEEDNEEGTDDGEDMDYSEHSAAGSTSNPPQWKNEYGQQTEYGDAEGGSSTAKDKPSKASARGSRPAFNLCGLSITTIRVFNAFAIFIHFLFSMVAIGGRYADSSPQIYQLKQDRTQVLFLGSCHAGMPTIV